jgi:hypothetical protein
MTLNSNFAGAVLMVPRGRLEGPERGLDAIVGLVILLAELAIGVIALFALYEAGTAIVGTNPSATDAIEGGFAIAVFGSAAAVLVTTIIYLVRIIMGRRSWPAPLWGTVIMTAALLIGYGIMFG